MAFVAAEALLVPHCSLSKLLLGSEDGTSASWAAALTFLRLDGGRASDDEWSVRCYVILTEIFTTVESTINAFSSLDLPHSISLQETTTTTEAIAMRSPLLAIASFTVNVLVGTVACVDGVECLGAVFALEALAMPFASLGEHQLSHKYCTAASWATLARCRHDRGRVRHGGLGCVGLAKRGKK